MIAGALLAAAGCQITRDYREEALPEPATTPGAEAVPTPTPEPGMVPLPSPAADMQLLVQADLEGDNDIYLLDFSEGAGRNLTLNPADDSQPAWSPDRETIAFVSDRDGNPEIYLIASDGSDLRRVTETPGAEAYPAWSADGKTLAFFCTETGVDKLCLLDMDTGVRRFLAPFEEGKGGTMLFCPGGDEMILGYGKLDQYKNYTLDLVEEKPKEIINHPAEGSGMCWSLDGSALIYASAKGKETDIWMVYLDEGRYIQLTKDLGEDHSPSLSPDGAWMVFSSRRDGNDFHQLYILSLAGDPLKNQVYRLTDDEADYRYPQWR